MKTFYLFIVYSALLFSCNNPKRKEIHLQSSDNINYEDQELELKDKNKILKFMLSRISIHNNQIKIQYRDSLQDFSFYIFSLKDSTWCQFVQEFSILDSSYRKPNFTIIEKDIHLKEIEKSNGSKLTGSINAKIERHHTWVEDFKDTVIITGLINARLD